MTKKSLILAACLASQLGFAVTAAAQSNQLLAGNVAEPDLGALPSRARKSAAPEINQPLKFEAVRNETHPALRTTLLLGEEVLRLVGAGFGREAGGREVQLRSGGETYILTVLSWRDDEIRVQIPELSELGIDLKIASGYQQELARSKKAVLGPNVEIGIALEGRWVAKRTGQLAVAYRDVDGDGSLSAEDCDDFDPRRKPGNRESYDAEGIDEDCNASTQATAPAAPVAPALPAVVATEVDALDSPEL